jgi:hypothetical protein
MLNVVSVQLKIRDHVAFKKQMNGCIMRALGSRWSRNCAIGFVDRTISLEKCLNHQVVLFGSIRQRSLTTNICGVNGEHYIRGAVAPQIHVLSP